MKTRTQSLFVAPLTLLALLTLNAQLTTLHAQLTTFTYQGRLTDSGAPANGSYDIAFTLYPASAGSTAIAGPVTNSAVGVTNGLFTTTVDFGHVFTNASTWLAMAVSAHGANAFSPLTPRQQLTPVPYAIFAETANNAVSATTAATAASASSATTAGSATTATTANNFSGSLAGDVTGKQSSTAVAKVGGVTAANVASGANAANAATSANTANAIVKRDASGNFSAGTIAASAFSGNGANVTNVNAATLGGLNATNFWQTGGNGGTNPTNGAFLGTTDNEPLEFRVNNQRALRLESASDGAGDESVNVIAGYRGNFVAAGVAGATIAGGGFSNAISIYPNSATADFATVSGGGGNSATNNGATVAGGLYNTAGGDGASVAGGLFNAARGSFAAVGGGDQNQASGAGAFIGGGGTDGSNFSGNTASGNASVVAGGMGNQATNDYAAVGGGYQNIASGVDAFVGGGYTNIAGGSGATVGGGEANVASGLGAIVGGGDINVASGDHSVIAGGLENLATNAEATVLGGGGNIAGGQYSFAAGHRAQALNDGAFVWADDSSGSPFASSQNNSFNVRAQGGARFVTGGAGMTIDGQSVLTTGSGSLGLDIQQNATSPNLVLGCSGNSAAGGVYGATIGGGGESGSGNSVAGLFGTVSGGKGNQATSNDGTVGGGQLNKAGSDATVGGGSENQATGSGAFVGGGGTDGSNFVGNTASGAASVVTGGLGNQATTNDAVVGGGQYNTAAGINATVGGGDLNTASGDDATVVGGFENLASGAGATVGGGYGNAASGRGSFAAGRVAQALNDGSFVWSDGSSASPFASTADNQFLIHAAGGVGIGTTTPHSLLEVSSPNTQRSTVFSGPGGGTWSFYDTTANSYLWDVSGGTSGFSISISGVGYPFYIAKSTGDVGIGNTSPGHLLTVGSGGAYCDGTTWENGSDRNSKQNFTSINPAEVLQKVAALPITEWQYKVEPGREHIGPMAQDFHAAFGLNGSDDKHISTVDEGGVALAAIQGLNKKVKSGKRKVEIQMDELKTENAQLQSQVTDLRSQLEALQKAVARLTEKSASTVALNTQPQEAK